MRVLWARVAGVGWLPLDPKVWPADHAAATVAVSDDPLDRSKRVGRFLAKTATTAPHERRHRKHDDVCPVLHPEPDEPAPAEQLLLIPDVPPSTSAGALL